MIKLFTGFLAGLFAGFLLEVVVPIEIFFAACIVLIVFAVWLLFAFHLGLRDFQEY